MASNRILPAASATLSDGRGLTTPQFYRFFQSLAELDVNSASQADIAALQAELAAIQAEIDALPAPQYPVLQVQPPIISQGLLQNGFAQLGLTVANSVSVFGNALQLTNDNAAPGNTLYYGTGPAGIKGWNTVASALAVASTSRMTQTIGANGVSTFDLATVADSGAGTLLAVTRDAYGRVTGTKAATITGTATRITVANGDASAGLPTIDLAAVTDAGGGSLLKFVRDAWGRITGTSTPAIADLKGAGLVVPQGYIDGLQMVWNSSTSISVTSGAAYIPSLGNVLASNSTLTLSGLSLTASTWYHVYLYSNAGTPAIECVTTAPVLYNGTAYQKTGDASRRYVGSVLGTGSGVTNFYNSGNFFSWRSNGAILVNQFNSQISGNPQIIDLSSAMPVTAQEVVLRLQNNSSSTNAQLGPLPWDGPVYPIPPAIAAGASGFTVIAQMSAPTQQIGANTSGGTPNNNLQVLVMAYIYQR